MPAVVSCTCGEGGGEGGDREHSVNNFSELLMMIGRIALSAAEPL